MNALVTGAHGFIGSHLCECLLARGHTVKALVSPWGDLTNLSAVQQHPNLTILRADITNQDSIHGSCAGCDVVFHAAARVAEWGRYEPFYKTNVHGTDLLIHDAIQHNVRRFVLISSITVHQYSGYKNADTRTLPRDGNVNAYAKSKVTAEHHLEQTQQLEWVIVRPGLFPFGPRDSNFERQIDALKGGLMPLVNGGRAVMNTAFVMNLVEGIALCGEHPDAAGRQYLIADDGMVSWREFFTVLAELVGAPVPRLSLPSAVALPLGRGVEGLWRQFAPETRPPLAYYLAYLVSRDVHFSIDAAKRELGYVPRYSWQDGLAMTVKYFSEG